MRSVPVFDDDDVKEWTRCRETGASQRDEKFFGEGVGKRRSRCKGASSQDFKAGQTRSSAQRVAQLAVLAAVGGTHPSNLGQLRNCHL